MRAGLLRLLDSAHAPLIGSLVTLALGLFFTFVWAPHPWGWQGIDAYHELARVLARGGSFPTTDVPWGYAYYAAFFYKVSGERMWTPLVGQVIANAFVPPLLYGLVAPLAGRRIAGLSALVVGVFSFATIYASTQSSDTICTVMFLAGLLAFSKGASRLSLAWFVASGALLGLAPQFRPNLVLLPGVMMAAYLLLRPRRAVKLAYMAAFGLVVVVIQIPWIAHTYRLTGLLLPTSTHGGVQLWYGTLQVGPFLESRAHNPRFYFESAPFDYTSLWQRPIHLSTTDNRCLTPAVPTSLVYWTDRDPSPRRIASVPSTSIEFLVPPQPDTTTLYFYFEQRGPLPDGTVRTYTTPIGGASNPRVLFVSTNHLGDLDRHDDVLDVFDLIRLLRHIAWQEPLSLGRLDRNADGRFDQSDVAAIVTLQIPELVTGLATPAVAGIDVSDTAATLRLADGSWLAVPRAFSGRFTDVDLSLHGAMAPGLVSRHHTWSAIDAGAPPRGICQPASDVHVNALFNWSEPHLMQRYMALAFDNIERDPGAFIRASIYRMVRLFVVRGTSDLSTAQQFRGSALVYRAGTALSLVYLGVFAAGVVVAFRRRSALLLLLIPIVYVPLTICFVLTNMRYTVTVQPLMFVFVAVAMAAALKLEEGGVSGGDDRVLTRAVASERPQWLR